MTGSALMDFLIAIIGLCLIVALFFLAIEKISPDEFFKKVARYAIGGVALIAFLLAVKGVLFGGTGAISVTPMGLIQFAIGLLVVMVVLYLVYLVVDFLAPDPFRIPIKYVVGAIALISLLILAQGVLFGGGFNMMNLSTHQRSELEAPNRPFRGASITGAAFIALPGRASVDLHRVLS